MSMSIYACTETRTFHNTAESDLQGQGKNSGEIMKNGSYLGLLFKATVFERHYVTQFPIAKVHSALQKCWKPLLS